MIESGDSTEEMQHVSLGWDATEVTQRKTVQNAQNKGLQLEEWC